MPVLQVICTSQSENPSPGFDEVFRQGPPTKQAQNLAMRIPLDLKAQCLAFQVHWSGSNILKSLPGSPSPIVQ